MEKKLQLEKIKNYEDLIPPYPDLVKDAFAFICMETRTDIQNDIKQLAEQSYKEGFKDGLRFASWLNNELAW